MYSRWDGRQVNNEFPVIIFAERSKVAPVWKSDDGSTFPRSPTCEEEK